MNSIIRQIAKKIYWGSPFSNEFKDRLLGKIRSSLRKIKHVMQGGNFCSGKDDIYKNYARQILEIPSKSSDDYVELAQTKFNRMPTDPKLIAYYLPQFHPTVENDRWWGKGVTEWNNVSRAVPQYVGHYQPRLPGELGYYDLRISENLERQVELARSHGVFGFAFYYYWFDGERLLSKPLDMFVASERIDFPFCLCWANESWTRRFDGSCGEILMKQSATLKSYQTFIDSVIPYMQSQKYIRVDGRPLLNIYRPSFIPDCAEILKYWRARCVSAGVGDIYIVGAKEHTWDADLLSIGFDALNEFHPGTIFRHCVDITNHFAYLRDDFSGQVYDYKDLVSNKKYFNFTSEKLFRAVMPMWDNTARRDNKGMIFHGSSPGLYKSWLLDVFKELKSRHDLPEPFVFINAWNEWGEGAYLEPDRRYGYAYLAATRSAIEEVR